MTDNNFDFLKDIKTIIERSEEITRLKQERFNIFSVLRKDHDENNLHSAFLTELLNPEGRHDLGNAFLKIFIEEFKLSDILNIENPITVKKEKTIEEGRVDIYLEDTTQKSVVLIENKIHARDQDRQLERYHNHITNSKKGKGKLLYLTLKGKEASEESKKDLKEEDYFCISYSEDIFSWLEKCMKEAADVPTVRETIKQYMNLIKKLTGGLQNQMEENEIIEKIIENYEESNWIKKNIWRAEVKIIRQFLEDLEKDLRKKLAERLDKEEWEVKLDEKLYDEYKGVSIRYKKWDENISIKFERQGHKYPQWCILGIRDNKNKIARKKINEELKDKKEIYSESREWFPLYRWIPTGNNVFKFIKQLLNEDDKKDQLK